ncbi:hypothetical protein C8A05DRAFT_18092, partial [Staphylotrichum tortipilum]
MTSDHGSPTSGSSSSSTSDPGGAPLDLQLDEPGVTAALSSASSHVSSDDADIVSPRDSPRSSSPDPDQDAPAPVTMTARAYQREMLEESLKQNIIVTMDTGSGKTQVAILRIQAELERSRKIAWFLAPTVSLADQQFEAIRAQTPGVQSKLITGSDNVQAWSTKPGVWHAVLLNTRIVVSTYQILFDAVTHALVPLPALSLIVIDEAHNCVGDSPVKRLMIEHYAPSKAKGLHVPHILGLTASPLIRSKLEDLEVLEKTLDSVCKTPSKHRDELMEQVNRPEMSILHYGGTLPLEYPPGPSSTVSRLKSITNGLDIKQDPYIQHLLSENTPRSKEKLKQAVLCRKTYSRSQMEAFHRRAKEVHEHLGPWAAEYYIFKVVLRFLQDADTPCRPSGDLAEREQQYLAEAFRKLDARPPPEIPTALSAKVQVLLDALESHQGRPLGIVFVKERATVTLLSHILSVHPKTAGRYRVGSMVGTAKTPGRRQDFLDLSQKDYLLSLQDFRKGTTNLLVATSVLEEGIDVPACNLVVCFDKPAQLKSFIQRRGRARMASSHLYLLVESELDTSSHEWEHLEREMKRRYEDDMREAKRLQQLEDADDREYPVLRDAGTGAQLTILDAKQHLDHFCATLSRRKFVDWSPFYVVQDLNGNPVDAHAPGLRKATVHLPVTLPLELRRFESLFAWASEAKACKDAAFQAYAGLYRAGLVNGHLLPIRETDLIQGVEQRVGLAVVAEQMNPWPVVANGWREGGKVSRRRMVITRGDGEARVELEVVLPVDVPWMERFTLHWDEKSEWVVSMEADTDMMGEVEEGMDHSLALLGLAFGHRWQVQEEKQYPVRFVCLDRDVSFGGVGEQEPSAELLAGVASTHLIRDVGNQNHPHFCLGWLPSKPSAELVGKVDTNFDEQPEDAPYVVVKSWPKKAGFFRPVHPNPTQSPSTKPYPRVLPAGQVRVDSTPAVYSHIGFLIPAITHALEVHLVAKDLLECRLEQTGITDLSLVVTAISTSASRGPTDYERIEFLGDSILKFCTTINCSAQNLKYPEGFLSPLKDNIVSNSRLFHAAVDFGLDRYIIYKGFTLHKWRPNYVEDILSHPPAAAEKRQLSTKTLADVVEALIGTSFISGGLPKALSCMSLLLPQFKWHSIDHSRAVLNAEAPPDELLPASMDGIESLLGYTFTKKSLLLEALTHPSCHGPSVRASLDRLEFLGDAILDYVVVTHLFADPALDNPTLHLLKTALVNADILAFFVMEWTTPPAETPSRVDAITDPATGDVTLTTSHPPRPLWSFLRHASQEMGAAQRATAQRHAAVRGPLLEALEKGGEYPWSMLCRLQAQKFYSDVFESVLGAVWVDSGSLAACEALVERAGVLGLMRRLVKEGVWCLHPKEELGRLAGGERVEYEVEVGVKEGSERWVVGEGERVFGC